MSNKRKPTHILLVEDVKFDREILKEAFNKADIVCIITECAGAEEALEQLQMDATKFDVAIVDHTLPGMSGLELIEAIIEKGINLPIIFLTGPGSEELAIQALKLGVDDYIIKGSKHHLEVLPLLVQKSAERHTNYMDRMEAEEELRRSEQRMSLHVMHTPLGVIEWNTNFEVTAWNHAAERIFGYSKNEALGHHACDIIVPESAKQQVDKRWDELLRKKGGRRSTNENVTKKGQRIICEWYNTPLVDTGGKVMGVASLVQDITERKIVEETLKDEKEKAENATRVKDKFVSLVAHDLRGPISTIWGYLQLLHSGELDSKHTETLLKEAMDTCEDMTDLISEILSLSRLNIGSIKPQSAFIDSKLIVEKILNKLLYLANQKGIILTNKIPKNSRIYADEKLLHVVIRNLVSNAIKFCRKGDTITLYNPKEEPSTIAVSDTGLGIKFERFETLFRYDKKTSTKGTANEPGTGLGLPLAHDIMKAHSGELKVDSVHGKGCTFYVKLPHVIPKILIVDDEKSIIDAIKNRLKIINAEFFEAVNGKKAKDIIENNSPHLIISDIMMPGFDGFELLEYVKNNPKTKTTPVIVITGDPRVETRDKAFQLGADDFIEKPFRSEDLIPRVRRMLNRPS